MNSDLTPEQHDKLIDRLCPQNKSGMSAHHRASLIREVDDIQRKLNELKKRHSSISKSRPKKR